MSQTEQQSQTGIVVLVLQSSLSFGPSQCLEAPRLSSLERGGDGQKQKEHFPNCPQEKVGQC